MPVFEYVASIYSIVLALSAANTLSALAHVIKHRRTVQGYWVHTAWCVSFLIMHLALWRGIWFTTGGWDELTIFQMLPYFQWVVFWYVASRLLAPDSEGSGVINLAEYYFTIKTPFLVCVYLPYVINVAWVSLLDPTALDLSLPILSTMLAMWGAAALGIWSSDRRVHGAVVIFCFVAQVVQEWLQGSIN